MILRILCTAVYVIVLASQYGICNDLQGLLEGECGNAKVDLVLVIDSSGSVESVFNAYKDAAVDLVHMLPIAPERTLLAVIQYNGLTYLKLELSDYQSTEIVNKTVSELEWLGGTTQSAEAVDLGISMYRKGRPDASRMFVLMTDGNSYNPWSRVQETAEKLHRTGAQIYIVALGDTMYEPELQEYAGPNGTIVKRPDFNKFKGEILDLTGFICHPVRRYKQFGASDIEEVNDASSPPPSYPSPPSSAPPSSSGNSVPGSGSSSATSGSISQKPGHGSSPLPPIQGCASDILFILDSSGSVRNDFETQIRFILDVVDSLTIDLSAHLVAVVEYAGEMRQRLQFSFTAYLQKADLISAIRALPFFSGTTATGEALKLGKHALGDRRKAVPALVFVLTDGFSQDDVIGPAAELRSEPNAEVYAVGVTASVNTKELLNIAGDSAHAFLDGNVTKVKTEVLPKHLNCGSVGISEATTVVNIEQSSSSLPPVTTTFTPAAPTTATPPTSTPGTSPPPPPPSATSPPTTTAAQTTELLTESPTTQSPSTLPPTPLPSSPAPTTPPATSSNSSPTAHPGTSPPTATPTENTPQPATGTSLSPPTENTLSPPVQTQSPVASSSSITPSAVITLPPSTPAPTTPELTTTPETTTPIPTTTTAASPTTVPTTLQPTTTQTAQPVIPGCLLDVLFVFDSSGSVTQTFRRELEFAANIVDRLVVGTQNAHIAAVKYAGPGKARAIFPFNKHNTAADVKSAILSTSFVSGTTATNEALQLAAQEYDPGKGARPGEAKFIVVVFTDGFSQDDPGQGSKLLQSKGATIYAIGVNSAYPVNKAELLEIAGDGSRVFTDETIESLYGALDRLEQACKDATGSGYSKTSEPLPQPPSPPQSGSASYVATPSAAPPGPPGTSTQSARPYPPRLQARR